MEIEFSKIFEQCQMLTSYESGRGESAALYEKVHLQDRDKAVIENYVTCALTEIAGALRFAILDCAMAESKISITFIKDSSINQRQDNWKELITCYCLSKWLEGKIEERAKGYKLMFDEMLKAMSKTAYRKRPTLQGDNTQQSSNK